MNTEDRDLKPSDIQLLTCPDGVAAFFAALGYNADDKSGARIKQSPSALGITPDTVAKSIKHVERIADQENGTLQVYLFELTSVTVAAIRSISRAFKNRAGKYLLVLTSDYETIDFVLLERVLPGKADRGVSIRPHILTVRRRKPELLDLRVHRRFTYTESDADAQFDKLLSAYSVAEWSERLFNNRALFSDHYLLERLPQSPQWAEQPKPYFIKFKELYASVRERLSGQKEAVVRERLLEPIFDILGFRYKQGKESSNAEAEPDYKLYRKDSAGSDKPVAVCLAYTWNRYLDGKDETRDTETPDENPGAHVVTLLEAGEAPWAVVTNGKVWRLYSARTHSRATNYYEIDLEETLAMADPQEAFRYFWLFFRAVAFAPEETVCKGEKLALSFLERILEESEAYAKELGEKLKTRVFEEIFPHFAEGFIENMGGAEHLLSLSAGEKEEKLKECFQGTLTFLYRLLFLLYAESRNLLPVKEVRGYWEISLTRLKEEIAGDAGSIRDEMPERLKKAYRSDSTELYDRLLKLFTAINDGNPEVNVPFYNGGLFITNPHPDDHSPEAENARFLCSHKIPDRYLAIGLDLIARDIDDKTHALASIDYKSLGVRHLGSIYEGLLEFKLHVASEKMAVVKGKKTEEVVTYSEAKNNKLTVLTTGRGKNAEERTLKKGTVYLENDKRERKATGSYYTPDHIVKYIVQNTVGPVLAEKLDALRPKLREAQQTLKNERDKYKALGGKGDLPENQTYIKHRHLVDELFDIKVLDPSMGSGHFLVEAVDFISDKILGDREGFLRAFPWNPITSEMEKTRQTILNEMEQCGVSVDRNRLTDVNLLKRHILKRCIYGVDLNPMAVELAKVSLWLDCFTVGAPLSFLDHHLRSGNSLIGISEKEFEEKQKGQMSLLASSKFTGARQAVGAMIQIGALPDITSEQARESRKQYGKASEALAPVKRLFDVYTSQWFGNRTIKSGKGKKAVEHNQALEFLRDGISEKWAYSPHEAKLPKQFHDVALTANEASKEKKFFHWELEFPEVFYGPRPGTTNIFERREGAGFDAVIGNPPYDVLASEELGFDVSQDLEFYENSPAFEPAIRGKKNLYKLFICRGSELIGKSGAFSYIVPMALLGDDQSAGVRRNLLEKTGLVLIESFPQKDDPENRVFKEAKLSTTLFVTRSSPSDKSFALRTHPGKFIENSSPMLKLAPKEILTFDPENSAIPSCTQRDWVLAEIIINNKKMKRLGEYCRAYQGEVNETTDGKRGFISTDSKDGPQILRGSTICLYVVREASQGEAIYLRKKKYLEGKPDSIKASHYAQSRIGWQESSPQNNFRRIIAAFIPEGEFCNHKINYIPVNDSKISLNLVLALLDSKISDWFFRLGSTNAAVSHYQIYSLPVCQFATDAVSVVVWQDLLNECNWSDLATLLCTACITPGVMPKPVAEALSEMSRAIQQIESKRVLANRSERSRLAPDSQPIQDAIDKVLFRCYGLSDDDAEYINKRLKEML